jgi:hypothetical protein
MMPNPTPTPLNFESLPSGAVYVTKRQAAEMLSMSPSWINKQMAEGRLRHYTISTRRVLFLRSDVLNLVKVSEQAK